MERQEEDGERSAPEYAPPQAQHSTSGSDPIHQRSTARPKRRKDVSLSIQPPKISFDIQAIQDEGDPDRTIDPSSIQSVNQDSEFQDTSIFTRRFLTPEADPDPEGAQFETLRDDASDLRAPTPASAVPSSDLEGFSGSQPRRIRGDGEDKTEEELQRRGSSRLSSNSSPGRRQRSSTLQKSSPLSFKSTKESGSSKASPKGRTRGLEKKRSSEPIASHLSDPRALLMEFFDREEVKKKARSHTVGLSEGEITSIRSRANQLVGTLLQQPVDLREEVDGESSKQSKSSLRYSDPIMPSTPLKQIKSRSDQSDTSSPKGTDGDDNSSLFGLGINLSRQRGLPYSLSRPPVPVGSSSSKQSSASPSAPPPTQVNSSFSDSSPSRTSLSGKLKGQQARNSSPLSFAGGDTRAAPARRSGGSSGFIQMDNQEDLQKASPSKLDKGKKPIRGGELETTDLADGKNPLHSTEGFAYQAGSSEPIQPRNNSPSSVASKKRRKTRSKLYRRLMQVLFISSQFLYVSIFFIFVAPFLWLQFHPAVVALAIYLFLVAGVSSIVASMRDPGSLPRNLDPDPPISSQSNLSGLERGLVEALGESPTKRGLVRAGEEFLRRTVWNRSRIVGANVDTTLDLQRATDASGAETEARKEGGRSIQVERGGQKTFLVINEGKSLQRSPKRTRKPRSQPRTPRRSQVGSSHFIVDPALRPMPRDYTIKGRFTVRTRWCDICQVYPPPRTYHCTICDHCVYDYQYHSTWLGNDVGRRNLVPAFAFLLFTTLSLTYVAVFTALHLAVLSKATMNEEFPGIHLSQPPGGNFKLALKSSPFSAVLFLMSFVGIGLVSLPRLYDHISCGLSGETLANLVSFKKRSRWLWQARSF